MDPLVLWITISLNSGCFNPNIINTSQEPWNSHDQKVLKKATNRCGELYKDAPCIKMFWKTEPRVYRVMCGGDNA